MFYDCVADGKQALLQLQQCFKRIKCCLFKRYPIAMIVENADEYNNIGFKIFDINRIYRLLFYHF